MVKWKYILLYGEMQTGWNNIDGKKYYLGSDGTMQKNTWIEDKNDGNWHHVNSDGIYGNRMDKRR